MVDEEGLRQTPDPKLGPQLKVGVPDAGEGDTEFLDESLSIRFRILDIDPYKPHSLSLVLAPSLLQRGRLLPARHAPGSPEVEHHRLPGKVLTPQKSSVPNTGSRKSGALVPINEPGAAVRNRLNPMKPTNNAGTKRKAVSRSARSFLAESALPQMGASPPQQSDLRLPPRLPSILAYEKIHRRPVMHPGINHLRIGRIEFQDRGGGRSRQPLPSRSILGAHGSLKT